MDISSKQRRASSANTAYPVLLPWLLSSVVIGVAAVLHVQSVHSALIRTHHHPLSQFCLSNTGTSRADKVVDFHLDSMDPVLREGIPTGGGVLGAALSRSFHALGFTSPHCHLHPQLTAC